MKYLSRILVCGFIILIAGFSTAFPQTTALQKIEKNVSQRIESSPLVGVAIGYISPEGEVSYLTKGTHSVDSEMLVSKKSVFKIASVTKVFTSLALAQLLQERGISLDREAEELLPADFSLPTFNGQAITVQHLVTHTSGLPRLPGNLAMNDIQNPYADYSRAKMISFLSDYELQRAPGTKFEYSNLGMAVAGHILEEQYEMDYDQVIQRKIAEPLNMNSTGIHLASADCSRFTRGHYQGVTVPYWDFPGVEGMGALKSTVSDMAAFLKAQLNPKNSKLAEAIFQTQEPLFDISDEKPKQLDKVGMGWLLSTKQDSIMWHNGGTGGYHSFAGYNIEKGTGVVVLSNAREGIDDIGFHLLDPQHSLSKN